MQKVFVNLVQLDLFCISFREFLNLQKRYINTCIIIYLYNSKTKTIHTYLYVCEEVHKLNENYNHWT